jgi:spermidine synthase
VLVTQAGSPYVTTAAFKSIKKSISYAGFHTLPIHNHVFSFGEWGWILGAKNIEKDSMKKVLLNTNFSDMETKWINNEAMYHITSFGQDFRETGNIEINTLFDPVTYIYYERGISRITY